MVLKIEKVGINDNFFELGGHSLLILKLASKVRKLGLKIEIKDLLGHQTIEQQSNFIKTSLMLLDTASKGKFVIPIQPEGNNIPLFAFPEFLLFSGIGKHISKNQPLYSIEPSPFNTVKETVNHYISAIKEVRPHGPYLLAGYCQYAEIAVEMAHTLIEEGEDVPVLVLIEYFSPTIKSSRASLKFIRSKIKFIVKNWRSETSFLKRGKFLFGELVYTLEFFIRLFIRTGKKNSNTINKTYTGKVILFQASETYGYKEDLHMGWGEIFTGDVKKYIIESDHLSIIGGPAAVQIAQHLNEELA